jgi:hypothetical protein
VARPFRFVALVWPPSPGQWKGLADTIEDIYRRLRDGLDRIVTLSGDVSGSGTDEITTTLASVNANVGAFGDSTHIPTLTLDAKGRVTAASQTAVVAGQSSAQILARVWLRD